MTMPTQILTLFPHCKGGPLFRSEYGEACVATVRIINVGLQGRIGCDATLTANPNPADWQMTSRPHAGFTLLELLVVLSIIGITVAISLPLFYAIYQNITRDFKESGVVRQFANLPIRAITKRAPILIPAGASSASVAGIEIPEHWSLMVTKRIVVKSSGYCEGGGFVLRNRSQESHWLLEKPFCDAIRSEETARAQ